MNDIQPTDGAVELASEIRWRSVFALPYNDAIQTYTVDTLNIPRLVGIGSVIAKWPKALHGLERRGQDNEIGFALYTLISNCSFIPNGFYPYNYPQMAGEGQCLRRQSEDNRTIVIMSIAMALLWLTLSLLAKEQ